MKINWKIRLKNKAYLVAIISGIVALVYQILGAFGVVPTISQSDLLNIIGMLINVLVLAGVVVDPTTSGVSDSDRALTYGKSDYTEVSTMGKGNGADTEETEVEGANNNDL